jgi:hypothetical protein
LAELTDDEILELERLAQLQGCEPQPH